MKNKSLIIFFGLVFGCVFAYFLLGLEKHNQKNTSLISLNLPAKTKVKKEIKENLKDEIEKLQSNISTKKFSKEELRVSQTMWNIGKRLKEKRIQGTIAEVSDKELFQIMEVQQRTSFIIANMIIQDRGLFEEAFELATKFDTSLIKDFLYSYNYPAILEISGNREMRQRLIKSYLSGKSSNQIVHTIDSLNQLDFNLNEVLELKKTFCSQGIPKKNEAQIALHYKFHNFLIKYDVDGC